MFVESATIDAFGIKISLYTTEDLDAELFELKQDLGMSILVGFDNANIVLKQFHLEAASAKLAVLKDAIKRHYASECISQAFKIIGAVDFLGNPAGADESSHIRPCAD